MMKFSLIIEKIGRRCCRLGTLLPILIVLALVSPDKLIAQQNITVQFNNVPFTRVLQELKAKTKYEYLYNNDEVKSVGNVSGVFKNATLSEILTACLKDTGFSFTIEKNVIVIIPPKNFKKQESITVRGRIVDESGQTLPGVAVMIKGQRVGMSTEKDGEFNFGVPSKNVVLILSFLGMKTLEINVASLKDLDRMHTFTMHSDNQQVEEVVVTGYLTLKKSSFTGASVSVNREELMQVSKTNVIQAIQAFDPSFRIQENSLMGSNPNAIPEVYIRGRSGIGVKELDKEGMSKSELMNNPNLPTFIMDGFKIDVQKLYDMDPNRIENITILKDAAATAMYGSRAANGVVIITTVPPKDGRVTVDYNMVGTMSMPDLSDYNLMNAAEKLETERRAGGFIGKNSNDQLSKDKEYYGKLRNVLRGVDTYWMSQPLRSVFNHKHSINITGGAEKLRFAVDLSYNNDNGVMKDSYRDRMSAAVSLDYRVGNFQVKNQISYGTTKSKESPYGSFGDYTKKLPYDEVRDQNGSYLENTYPWGGSSLGSYPNPLYEATLRSFDRSKSEELINNLGLNWYINDNWMIKGQFSVNKGVGFDETFIDPRSRHNTNQQTNINVLSGELSTSDMNTLSWDTNAMLSYNQSINKHNMNFTGGINATSSNSREIGLEYRGFPSGSLSSPNYAQSIYGKPIVSQGLSRLFGALASFNYTYNNIYLADLSVRFDGSSEFGSNKRFAPFWASGVGLNIHNYDFMKSAKSIDVLKVRASYGLTGKVNFSPYDAQTMYKIYNDDWYKTGIGASLMALGNHDLGWEKTHNLDVGIDLQMFNGKIQFIASYYNKKTIDLVNSVTIPSSTGFSTYVDNIGEVLNRGFELQVKSNVINTKDWYVSVFGNLSHNKNKIVKISESLKAYNNKVKEKYEGFYETKYSKLDPQYSRVFMQYVEGGSLTSIFGVKSNGINPADGREIFVRPDGSITYDWQAGDQVVLGNTEPTARGTFGFNARWKNLTLYTTFMYEFGGQCYNSTLVGRVENASIMTQNVDKRILSDRWQKPGDIAKYKRLAAEIDEITRPSSRFVQDYNVLSFNSLTLGYEFDRELVKKAHIGMLRVELGANDIFRLSSVKLERGLDYPYARSFNISVKLTF